MKHSKHILPAITLLQNAKEQKRLPWWLVPLDYLLTALYLVTFVGAIVWAIYMICNG